MFFEKIVLTHVILMNLVMLNIFASLPHILTFIEIQAF